MWSAWIWKAAAKQQSRRLRRNEFSRSTSFHRSARRRPLAVGGARLLRCSGLCNGCGVWLVHVRLERRSAAAAKGAGGRAGPARAIRKQAAARSESRRLQGAAWRNGAQLWRHAAAIARQNRGAESSGRHFANRFGCGTAGKAVPTRRREKQRLLRGTADQDQAGRHLP